MHKLQCIEQTGKAQIPTAVTNEIGGYSSVYMKDPTSTIAFDDWVAASHSFSFKLPKLKGYAFTDVNFDPAVTQQWTAALNAVNVKPTAATATASTAASTSTVVHTKDSLSAYAMIPLPKYGSFGAETVEGVLIRGYVLFITACTLLLSCTFMLILAV
jgi:hypothetical protein